MQRRPRRDGGQGIRPPAPPRQVQLRGPLRGSPAGIVRHPTVGLQAQGAPARAHVTVHCGKPLMQIAAAGAPIFNADGGINFTLTARAPGFKKSLVGMLHSAYLRMFFLLGYEYVFNPNVEPLQKTSLTWPPAASGGTRSTSTSPATPKGCSRCRSTTPGSGPASSRHNEFRARGPRWSVLPLPAERCRRASAASRARAAPPAGGTCYGSTRTYRESGQTNLRNAVRVSRLVESPARQVEPPLRRRRHPG